MTRLILYLYSSIISFCSRYFLAVIIRSFMHFLARQDAINYSGTFKRLPMSVSNSVEKDDSPGVQVV